MRNMTTGRPISHLWRYALPLLLGNWLQLSYNAVDSIIAGRFIGYQALAAEGIAAPVMNLVILAISGICIGSGVLMSEAFGAGNEEKLKRVLATTLRFGGALCVVIAGIGAVAVPKILRALDVPAEIFDITCAYLRVTFLGAPFTFFYNALAAGLKSVGDADTPLKFLAFSAVLNALLDLIFLGILGFGILCSAITTVVAEAVSAGLSLWYMTKKKRELIPRGDQWKTDSKLLREILRYAAPSAMQQAIQPVCKVMIQNQVNLLGVDSIAAFNAVTRMDDFACLPCQNISAAISTYIAQNRGAGRDDRIRSGFRAGMCLEFAYGIFIATVTLLLRAPLVSLFVEGENAAQVIALGVEYLGYMAFFYIYPAPTNGLQGFFRGMGKMYTTVAATTLQVSLRTVCTFLLAPRYGIVGIAFSCAIGWTAMLLFEGPYYFLTCRKRKLPAKE